MIMGTIMGTITTTHTITIMTMITVMITAAITATADAAQSKIISGSSAETTQFGKSTTLLMRKSMATLQMM